MVSVSIYLFFIVFYAFGHACLLASIKRCCSTHCTPCSPQPLVNPELSWGQIEVTCGVSHHIRCFVQQLIKLVSRFLFQEVL